MARQIKLSRDERIALNEAIKNGGQFEMITTEIPTYKVEQLVIKLQHRGLLNGLRRITEQGRSAYNAARKTAPKVATTA